LICFIVGVSHNDEVDTSAVLPFVQVHISILILSILLLYLFLLIKIGLKI